LPFFKKNLINFYLVPAPLPFFVSGLRFHFRVRRSVYFPPMKAGNLIRSALGVAMKRIHCGGYSESTCSNVDACPQATDCHYARVFAPRAPQGWPSGYADLPRPFVIRAAHLDGRNFPALTGFHFDLLLLSPSRAVYRPLGCAIVDFAKGCFGPGDGLVEVSRIESLGLDQEPVGSFDGKNLAKFDLSLPEPAACETDQCLEVEYVSPLDLRAQGQTVSEPIFSILFARLRERVILLSALYQGGAFGHAKELIDLARRVEATAWDGGSLSVARRSASQHRSHDIGGILGTATYRGPVNPFLPWLQAAQWTGIGKHAVWGNGQFRFKVRSLA